MTLCSTENVQILLLQATYYEANARHFDFWRSTIAASMACQVVIECQTIDWLSHRGDMITRAYWACVLNEDLYHLDLDLPRSGIVTLEDKVPLPCFYTTQEPQRGIEPVTDECSQIECHFLAMITLHRLIARAHSVIRNCTYLTCPPKFASLTPQQLLPHRWSPRTTTAARRLY